MTEGKILMPKNNAQEEVRLDKWLWAARFYKTRSIARSMIEGGKVDYNGVKAKPSRISDVRGPAVQAQTLYQETEESIKLREKQLEQIKINALLAPHPDEKPNKKERRALISMKYGW